MTGIKYSDLYDSTQCSWFFLCVDNAVYSEVLLFFGIVLHSWYGIHFFFFLFMWVTYGYVYAMTCVWPVGDGENLEHWTICTNFSTKFIQTCLAYRHHWLPPVYTLTLASIETFIDWFLSDLVWWQMPLNCIVWHQFEWPWPSFEVMNISESRNFCIHYLTIFSIDLDKIWYAAVAYRSVEDHAFFFSFLFFYFLFFAWWIFKGETSTQVTLKKNMFKIDLCSCT